MKRIIKVSCFILSVLYSSTVFAEIVGMDKEQKFVVGNNDTIIGIASRGEITRIVFEAGSIDTVHAIGGEIQYTVNGKDLYIKVNVEKPINFFVKTSLCHTYKFILDVRDVPATQILVRDKSKHKLVKKEHVAKATEEKISKYNKERIAQIIDISLKPKLYVGFVFNKTYKNLGRSKGLLFEQVGTITGKHLEAKKIIITNVSKTPLVLNSRDFIEEEVMALYLDKGYLEIGEDAVLIKIREQYG